MSVCLVCVSVSVRACPYTVCLRDSASQAQTIPEGPNLPYLEFNGASVCVCVRNQDFQIKLKLGVRSENQKQPKTTLFWLSMP